MLSPVLLLAPVVCWDSFCGPGGASDRLRTPRRAPRPACIASALSLVAGPTRSLQGGTYSRRCEYRRYTMRPHRRGLGGVAG